MPIPFGFVVKKLLNNLSGQKTARIVKGAKDIYYPGAPHGMFATHQTQVNNDLLNFLKS